jgi:DNA-binding IclR family transcriptional regulator
MLDMTRTTIHRYAKTLVALGYLEQTVRQQYRLTLGLTRLGMETMNATDLREHALPFLHELVKRTKLTVSLAVLDGPLTQYVDRIYGRRSGRAEPLNALMRLPLPAHTTALGKLLLAYLPTAAQREVLGELTLTKLGPKTITNMRRLRGELREIREEGIALADEDLIARYGAIAAPVRNYASEVVAAVGLGADQRVIDVEILADELGPHLLATADRISARLGYRRPDEPRNLLDDRYSIAFCTGQ